MAIELDVVEISYPSLESKRQDDKHAADNQQRAVTPGSDDRVSEEQDAERG